jgi:hypothetical protein
MNCARCGLTNPPYLEACDFCSRFLQTPEQSREKRIYWEGLPETARQEFDGKYRKDRERFERWKEKLHRDRFKHAAVAAAFYTVSSQVFHWSIAAGGCGAFLLALLGDLAGGAAAGHLVNRLRGGEYRGTAAFGALYVVATSAKMATGAITSIFGGLGLAGAGVGLFVIAGLLASLVMGYLFGMHLTLEKSLE